jgi:hypothetical protein
VFSALFGIPSYRPPFCHVPGVGFGRALLFLNRRREWSIFWSALRDEQGKRSLQIGTIGLDAASLLLSNKVL